MPPFCCSINLLAIQEIVMPLKDGLRYPNLGVSLDTTSRQILKIRCCILGLLEWLQALHKEF